MPPSGDKDTAAIVSTLEHIKRAGVLCGLTESVNPLMVGLKYTALGALYQVHGETKKALGVWKKLGSGKLKEEGCDGIVPTVELLAELSVPLIPSYQ